MRLDKRKTSQFPVLSLRQEGELRFGEIHMPVRLLDQSASGIAVMAKQSPGVEVGSTGLLRAGDDWFEIRLINIVPLEPPAGDEASKPEGQIQRFRLGLFRLSDAVDPDIKHSWWSWRGLRFHLDNILPVNTSAFGFGLLFVIMVILLPTLTILFLCNSKGISISDLVRFTKRIAAANKSGKNQPNRDGQSTATGLAPSDDSQSKDITSRSSLADFPNELKNIISRKPGATVFLVPEVVRQLDINEEQQRRIKEIVDATAEIAAEMEARFNRKISPKQSEELLKIARKTALQLLTDEQRSKWLILSDEKPQEKSVAGVKADK